MATPSKPLFYETSKCVTLYLDPNKRLQLNLRCPTFRPIHKTQPLRIRDLKLQKRSIEINGTSYKVGIITKYPQEVTPPGLIVFENATGSLQFDVDRYGFPKESDEENSGKEEAEIELLEQNFRIMRFTKDWLEMTNLAEDMQKNNEEPPFTHYLQLTIRIGDDLEKVERMEYNQAIKVAKEYLLKKVFSVEDIQKNPIVQSIQIRPYLLSTNLMFDLQNGNFLCVTGRSSLRAFSGRHNNRIHLERCELEEEDFKIMMEQLIGMESRVGIYYSLGFRSGPDVAPLFQLFRNFPGAERGEIEDRTWSQISESIVIPLKNDTELVFSCDEPSGEELEYCSSKFVVKMKVEPRGKTDVMGLAMTTPSKPLFYETAKCVTLYLDPNKRLQLSLRCPSFRSIHKTEPLRIGDLKFQRGNFEINGTRYAVGIFTKYSGVRTPIMIDHENMTGGLQYDVDKYGFPVDKKERDEEEEAIKLLEQDFRLMAFPRKMLTLTSEAKCMRKYNVKPPFTHYVQLTIRTERDWKSKVERVTYNQSIKVAKEYVLKKVFSVNTQKNPIVQSIQIRPYLLSINLMFELQNSNFLCVIGRSSIREFCGRHNNRIHLERCHVEEEDFKVMMEELNETESRVGRYYSIGYQTGPSIAPLLQLFKNLPGAGKGEIEQKRWSQLSDSIVIPLKNETELIVTCDKPSGDELDYCSLMFVVKMKVEPRGRTNVMGLCLPK
ncbi:hypothetical protein CRE_12065 [Caenorhabditis remanei]|uniref:Uncharacterized protein n=1 Tax=Caenorhabditis remanei TaxID=31234 RepID=E3MPQ4_CAERE|nr:hypothetical protein CRE_12065 [Caenorhabditis remanei]